MLVHIRAQLLTILKCDWSVKVTGYCLLINIHELRKTFTTTRSKQIRTSTKRFKQHYYVYYAAMVYSVRLYTIPGWAAPLNFTRSVRRLWRQFFRWERVCYRIQCYVPNVRSKGQGGSKSFRRLDIPFQRYGDI